jgi:hypothetical protein
MVPSLIIFACAILAMVLMVGLKMLSLSGRPIRIVTVASQKADAKVSVWSDKAKDVLKDWRTAMLLKFHDFVYDTFIPWTQRRYRFLASMVYRVHRKVWSLMEYSKQSSHKVSDYLRHVSEKEEKEDKNTPL